MNQILCKTMKNKSMKRKITPTNDYWILFYADKRAHQQKIQEKH